jgi:hypothetical protein
MGLFDKLFGGSKEKERAADTAVAEKPPCLHTALVPRWDSIDDIGHDDRVDHYICEACGEKFSPAQAASMRESAAERLVGPSPGEEPQ